jgi:hypothetical protein
LRVSRDLFVEAGISFGRWFARFFSAFLVTFCDLAGSDGPAFTSMLAIAWLKCDRLGGDFLPYAEMQQKRFPPRLMLVNLCESLCAFTHDVGVS